MKLHELEKDKIYIGEDGKEYKHDGWHLMDCLTLTAIICYATLTQDFTPKKVKRTVRITGWINKYPNYLSNFFLTKESADRSANSNRIACVEMNGSFEVEE